MPRMFELVLHYISIIFKYYIFAYTFNTFIYIYIYELNLLCTRAYTHTHTHTHTQILCSRHIIYTATKIYIYVVTSV